MHFLQKTKDKSVAALLRSIAGIYLQDIAKLTHLSIDSSKKEISCTLLLSGETSSVSGTLFYAFRETEDRTGKRDYLEIHHISASKPWVQNAGKRLFLNKPIPLRGKLHKLLKHLF
ncbi:MAG: hypothetical protein ACQEQ4_09100 [Fibrobacterota bacterium]